MVTRGIPMKKVLVLSLLLAFAPLAHAQEAGHWETRTFTEVVPAHQETRTRQVWQEPWIEVRTQILPDSTVEKIRIHHEGSWKTVSERVLVPATERRIQRQVWVKEDHVNPWDDSPRSLRTEQPTVILPSTRTEQPTAPRTGSLPSPGEKVEKDPFDALESRPVPVPAPAPTAPAPALPRVEVDPLIPDALVPVPAPAPQPPVVVRPAPASPCVTPAPVPPVVVAPEPAPPQIVIVREPAPAPRVVYVETCPRQVYYEDCGPRCYGPRVGIGVGVGVRVTRHLGVGVRIGF
jgi:hypothetical protein